MTSHRTSRSCRPVQIAVILVLLAASVGADNRKDDPAESWTPTPEECALLDDVKARGKMDGLLRELLLACGRQSELGQVRSADFRESVPAEGPGIPDVQVNDSTGDTSTSTTQSETSIARNEVTGTLCSGYNDSNDFSSFGGFSRSVDGGATWDDRESVPGPSGGDPSIVWRRADGKFYYALLRSGGLGIWRSDDDCLSFTFVAQIASGSDDKELMAVDNNPASPFFGRLYVVWTDFGAGSRIFSTFSDDAGASWSTQLALSGVGIDVQGAWPVVAPNGDVFVGWLRWNPWPSGPVDIEIARSTDGGVSYSLVINPMTAQVNPRDAGATGACGRPALNENIRYLPSPQLAVGPDGALHVVYSYDPDGFDVGDVVNVYYRKSTDSGATWGPEIQLNDDATSNDQYFPTLSVSPENILVSTWYDRRLDAANSLQDTFKSVSPDGGATWLANERVSDVSTPIYLDPELATCYHGDYDQIAQETGFALLQWSDDRNIQNGHNDPDVWFERAPVSNDFLLVGDPGEQDVCAPNDAVYTIEVLQFQGFSEPVTLAASGEPAGTTASFDVNPVIPPGSSTLTISGTGAAAVGSYAIQVTGTSDPSGIVRDTTVTLNLFDQAPDAPILTSPPDGAVDVDLLPTLQWAAAAQGTSYDVEVATDPAFSNIVFSDSTTNTSLTLTSPLDPVTTYFWRVRSSNVCGTGTDSVTFSFTTRSIPPILLVDDDDNSPDVLGFYTAALDALGETYDIWDTGNSDNEPSFAEAAPYETILWFTGDEFGGAAGPGAAGEAALASYLDAGGCLFLSSQDYHFDRNLTTFMQTYLGVASVSDDTGDYGAVSGVTGSIFEGLGPYSLDYVGPGLSDFADIVTPDGTALLALEGDNTNGAALQKDAGTYRTSFFVFPFPAISGAGNQQEVLQTVLDFCGLGSSIFADGFESGDTSAWSAAVP